MPNEKKTNTQTKGRSGTKSNMDRQTAGNDKGMGSAKSQQNSGSTTDKKKNESR